MEKKVIMIFIDKILAFDFDRLLDMFAATSLSVIVDEEGESIRGSSTLCEHCEAVINFEKVLTNKIERQYRKKRML